MVVVSVGFGFVGLIGCCFPGLIDGLVLGGEVTADLMLGGEVTADLMYGGEVTVGLM